jgi:hypothetical protein
MQDLAKSPMMLRDYYGTSKSVGANLSRGSAEAKIRAGAGYYDLAMRPAFRLRLTNLT